MPDDLHSPIKHHLVLHRVAGLPARLLPMIERDLFGTVRLMRNLGLIGSKGQELVEIHADEIAAGQALEAVAWVKRRRGYTDL